MKVTRFSFISVLFLGFIIITTQDITGRKGCDCSICKGVDNKINPIVGKKFSESDGGKSSCNICEHKKRMEQEERERQERLQKCPFEILGSSNIKGKTSEEAFDEFRELIVPSQNGFFDMMRGVVKTMRVSSEQELKWAKEKEAKELAKKREEEARKAKEPKPKQDEMVGLDSPINSKVTVVLKQTPCGQIVPQVEKTDSELETLMKRLPKDANGEISIPNEDEILRRIDLLQDYNTADTVAKDDLLYMNDNDNLLNSNLLQQLVGYNQWITEPPQEKTPESSTLPTEYYEYRDEINDIESETESPYVKFMTNEELKAQSGGLTESDSNLALELLPNFNEVEDTDNFTSDVEYTTESVDEYATEYVTEIDHNHVK